MNVIVVDNVNVMSSYWEPDINCLHRISWSRWYQSFWKSWVQFWVQRLFTLCEFSCSFSPSGKCWNSNSSCAVIALFSILSNFLFMCHHWTHYHMSCWKCWMTQEFLFVPKLLIFFFFFIFPRSALQTLHKVSSKAREHNYFLGGLTHDWVSYYEQRIESDRSCLNEWHAMDNLESRRPPSPDSVRTK